MGKVIAVTERSYHDLVSSSPVATGNPHLERLMHIKSVISQSPHVGVMLTFEKGRSRGPRHVNPIPHLETNSRVPISRFGD
ncbi:hypothetical protein TNCV_2415291 [Trichonephila clavipes]|nr:hypothetical protein TNCV_2415291 [Trichonephila clavipes]